MGGWQQRQGRGPRGIMEQVLARIGIKPLVDQFLI